MEIFKSKVELRAFLKNQSTHTIGFVPTMGALHKGHLSLLERARAENDLVVCSIYVNPTQFNNKTDLKNYPRTIDQDLAQLKSNGCSIAYVPSSDDIYPEGPVVETFNFGDLALRMEGKHRPGHFAGMATVVKRLLLTVNPTRAYFGKKDYQQWLIVQQLVTIENMKVEIIGCPIEREPDGLAMSSRNLRLSPRQRHAAAVIYEALIQIKESNRNKSVRKAVAKAIETINAHPDLAVEYLEVADSKTLQPINDWTESSSIRAFAAVYAGEIRLIDNVSLS